MDATAALARTRNRVIAFSLLAIVGIIWLGWIFVVPRELKTVIHFSRWHDSHVRASGYVEREPAGTRIFWEEFGNADGPPVVVLHARGASGEPRRREPAHAVVPQAVEI